MEALSFSLRGPVFTLRSTQAPVGHRGSWQYFMGCDDSFVDVPEDRTARGRRCVAIGPLPPNDTCAFKPVLFTEAREQKN